MTFWVACEACWLGEIGPKASREAPEAKAPLVSANATIPPSASSFLIAASVVKTSCALSASVIK
jgi:hypothetical protein